MKKVFLFLVSVLVTASLSAAEPKYVFLFIGDGMATPQRMVAEEFSRYVGHGKLTMNDMPFHATTRTAAANSLVTDSAAAATAIACGVKTNNGMIGVTPDGTPAQSVAEVARDNGKKVGIVSSVTLNHATPAGFYGHRVSRGMAYELGLDMVASGFDFFGGGTLDGANAKQPGIFEQLKDAGYTIAEGKEAINALQNGEKAYAYCGSYTIPYAIDNRDGIHPTLADITAAAIRVLDNPDGFFLMVEGGAIDWVGHGNEAATNLFEVIALDEAVRVAMKFYEEHPEETLIIVTGDHETGGMTMGFAGTGYAMYMERLANQKGTIGNFDGILKKAAKANPDMTFEDAKPLITDFFGLVFEGESPMLLSADEQKNLQDAFNNGQLPNALRIVMNNKAGIGWTSGAHTAMPVLTSSIGVSAEIFTGLIENTDISIKLKSIL